MARLLALEWDARQARVALGRTRGKEVVVEQAFAVDLAPGGADAASGDVDIGQRLAAALAARGVGSADALAAVGRGSIELRLLQLPPAPDEDLPEMVRFQAQRQFTAIGEDWPVDFIRVAGGEDSVSVLAAAISRESVGQIEQACRVGQLTLRRLVLRPFAAASLLRRRKRDGDARCCLMVDLLADEADLTVLADGQVSLMRTVRLPAQEDVEAESRALVGEIRRTTVAARNQLGGQRVDEIVLCGGAEEHGELQAALQQQLSLDVETFDPFDGLPLSRSLRRERPEHPGRYAPLLGMLADEAAGAGHAIDFLHPRQRPEPPNRRRRVLLAAALAASIVAALLGFGWLKIHAKDKKIAQLQQESARQDKLIDEANKQVRNLEQLDKFSASDVTWLDELAQLAQKLPPAEDAILTQVTVGERTPSGGQIILEGYVREAPMIVAMERNLMDSRHRVFGDRGNLDARRPVYRWQFKEKILVEPPTAEPATAAGETPPAPAPASQEAPESATPPASQEAPESEESPVAREAPDSEEAPVADEAPESEESPVARESTDSEEAPVADEAPESAARPASLSGEPGEKREGASS